MTARRTATPPKGLPPGPPLFDPSRLAYAVEASLLSEDLYAFAKAAWHVVEPGAAFRDNWHLQVICAHLQAVSWGEIRKLIINIPPRSMKSLLVSVLWPAWEWTWRPTRKWLFSSYGQALATRDALKTRRLIQSNWYQARWGHGSDWTKPFVLTSDQNAKVRYDNDKLGYRISTSVGGLGTGEGGDVVVVDDPHNVEEAESDAVRASTLTWWFETMSTRGNDPELVAKVVVMQRVHEADLTAACLERGGYEHLCLPMEFEVDHPTKSSTSLGFVDPRKKDGQLLWPERFTPGSLKALKTELGEYGTAGQLQQRPTPRGGGMFKEKFLKLWSKDKKLPALHYVLQSYDTAFTDKTTNDPTACTVWGLWKDTKERPNLILLDAWDDYLKYAQARKKLIKDWKEHYGVDRGDTSSVGRRPDAMLVEDKGSGIGIIQELQSAGLPARSYNPGKADKTSRANQVMPLYETGIIWIMESPSQPGQHIDWARPFTKQLTKFGPGVSAHDDYVDTTTQAIIFLRDSDMLDIEVVEEEPLAEKAYGPKPRNPYD